MEITILLFVVGFIAGFFFYGYINKPCEDNPDRVGVIKGGYRIVTPNPPPFVAKAGKWGTAVPSSFQKPKRIWKHKKSR